MYGGSIAASQGIARAVKAERTENSARQDIAKEAEGGDGL